MIEIIRPDPIVRPRLVVFDFDGTLSLVRSGWQELMRDLMVEVLLGAPRPEVSAELEQAAIQFIAESTGQPTLGQMAWLVDEVERRGGTAASAADYKRRFEERLRERIERRLAGQRRAAQPPDTLLVPGARALLEALRRRGVALALVSGTDRDAVIYEAGALEIVEYFGTRIYAPGPHDPGFAKLSAIAQLLSEEGLPGTALVGFGDGPVETTATRAAGGLPVGVALDEAHGTALDPAKRTALIAAGAGIIIPHFGEHARLVELIFDSDKMTR
jgi:phosphoglycolate phosphatase-like HAD superfamily hydrolase